MTSPSNDDDDDPAPDDPGSSRRLLVARTGIVLLLGSAAAIAYLTRHCLAVANTTMQQEIGLTNEQFGYLYGAFSLGYLIFQIPGGWLGQRLGVRITLPLMATCWAVMTCVTALVTSLPMLVASRLFFGLAQAGMVPNQAQALRSWIPDSGRGLASSFMVVAMSGGAIASLSLTGALMQQFSWRTIFIAYGIVTVAWSVLFWICYRDSPTESLRPRASAGSNETAVGKPATSGVPMLVLLMSLGVWGLSLQALFKTAGYNFLVTFLPTYLEFAHEVTPERAGVLASWSLGAVMAGSLLGGVLVDLVHRNTHSKRWSRSAVGAGSMLATAVVLAAAVYATTADSVALVIAVASFFSGISGAPTWATTIDLGGRSAGMVMGLLNSLSALAGIAISPLVGRLIDGLRETGADLTPVIWIHAVFYLLATISWLPVRPDNCLDRDNPAAQ